MVRSGHGPQAEVAQGFGLQPLVELGGRHLEGPEEEQRNEEEKETGEEKQPQRNTQVHMHGWDDACKADLSHRCDVNSTHQWPARSVLSTACCARPCA